MITPESADYFYKELENIIQSASFDKNSALQLKELLRQIINKSVDDEIQYFSSFYARLVYVLDRFEIPKETSNAIIHLRKRSRIVSRLKESDIKKADIIRGITVLSLLLSGISGIEIPGKIKKYISDRVEFQALDYEKKQTKINKLRGIISHKYKKEDKLITVFSSEETGPAILKLKGIWSNSENLLMKLSTINLVDVDFIPGNPPEIIVGHDSLLILEPDFLLDVTDIAECFTGNGFNVMLYFLKKFSEWSTGLPLLLGNMVNTCFDRLLEDPDTDPNLIYEEALKSRPLQLFAVATRDRAALKMLKPSFIKHYNSLKNVLSETGLIKQNELLSVEPSFISPLFGIQGRLDLLIEYPEDRSRKDIIELKSGRAPSTDLSAALPNGTRITTGIWPNNMAQTTCYNLLLDSSFENRTGSSQILYSKDDAHPLRNAPNIQGKKAEVMNCRNWIIAYEKSMLTGFHQLLNGLSSSGFGYRPSYVERDIAEFQRYYSGASELVRDYFHSFISFILRELFHEKTGSTDDNRRGCHSSLWLDSPEDKKLNFSIISGLVIDHEKSDFKQMHLIMTTDPDNIQNSSFRNGDIFILYPQSEKSGPENNQLIKGAIKNIGYDYIELTLRNKLVNRRHLESFESWILEPDHIDITNKKLFQSLFQLLKCPVEKQEILLGIREPNVSLKSGDLIDFPLPDELNDVQKELILKAINAEDYFLLQGPPGTGKTSYMLKNIIKILFESGPANILLLAYTNRAVDEICSTLLKIDNDFPFIRLGSRESSVHKDKLIPNLVDQLSMNEIYSKVLDTRVFVSTVSSVITTPEIFEIKEFDIAILDEASQVLEPQITGILSKVDKFILIGDEKQLPAVVTQPETASSCENDELKKINITDFRNSFFERLIGCCIQNNWDQAYGMLSYQGRMHEDIQEFPNKFFYANKLMIFPDMAWQTESDNLFASDSDYGLEKQLSSSRLVFIDSDKCATLKTDSFEADKVIEIINLIYEKEGETFSTESVGVISPFRAQCAEINRKLPVKLKDMVSVDTVERFQGSERKCIIMSCAVNHEYLLKSIAATANINGIEIDRKLNVALTRAKERIIILGNSKYLERLPSYRNLIDFIRDKGGYIMDYFG